MTSAVMHYEAKVELYRSCLSPENRAKYDAGQYYGLQPSPQYDAKLPPHHLGH